MMPGGKIMSVMPWRVMAEGVSTRCAIVVMLGRVILDQPLCIGITQDDSELAVQRRKHETCRNERPQTQHGQNEWSRPMTCTTVP